MNNNSVENSIENSTNEFLKMEKKNIKTENKKKIEEAEGTDMMRDQNFVRPNSVYYDTNEEVINVRDVHPLLDESYVDGFNAGLRLGKSWFKMMNKKQGGRTRKKKKTKRRRKRKNTRKRRKKRR